MPPRLRLFCPKLPAKKQAQQGSRRAFFDQSSSFLGSTGKVVECKLCRLLKSWQWWNTRLQMSKHTSGWFSVAFHTYLAKVLVNHYTFCLLCFYLKYLNMYASICFLTCISLQRCFFLLKPFRARDWKRRYDVGISAAVWVIVGTACLPFPIIRSTDLANNTESCFADLGYRKMNAMALVGMITAAELAGFVIPVVIIAWCTWKTTISLRQPPVAFQGISERQKALRMVYMCAAVFFICFTPYHINFIFYTMVKETIISSCPIVQSSLYFHPFCLCLASLCCLLDPILYYFMASEFRDQLSRHGSSVTRSHLMSRESGSSMIG
ncbi:putative P2Y purinoceptor 10 [Neophocaena asiaeorientalis asiaeorientalis]|uniref:P2Y purinoceptor 10 n=1 Tax=Neophocaena asiaeorientalis asiaeorientalis TaxID=1706337 RepID=A0A341CG93_NEOAA|nr:putative P2Y purinoceptor 10 [Neophocaena asiaeorientalis asiaeorientalis]